VDVALVFSANPEDYTARGKIISPLKDRIGSEIRTHYPASLELGMAITSQEAWTRRGGIEVDVPEYLNEVVEGIAFAAREDSRVDRRSGVSQRLSLSCLENVVSNAERRAARGGAAHTVARLGDVYAALPAVTGKIELEYEGEVRGADVVARDLVRSAVLRAFDRRIGEPETAEVVAWFEAGNMVRLDDDLSAPARLRDLAPVAGLMPLADRVCGRGGEEARAAAAEFVLEGLCARRRISRSEERLFMKAEPVLRASRRERRGAGGLDDDLMQ